MNPVGVSRLHRANRRTPAGTASPSDSNGVKKRRIKIAPSILSADFSRLKEEVRAVERCGADYIHIDIMDGHFVPNITAGPIIVEAVSRITSLPLDVHLMISNPERYIADFARAGSRIITVHTEATRHLHRTVQAIKDLGKKAGVSLNPATPVAEIEEILPDADLVLVMTVNPGFGGQSFIARCLPKIARIRAILDDNGLDHVELEVDGGIKVDNVSHVSRAGAHVFVSGSGIFHERSYSRTIREMRRRAESSPYPPS